MTLHSSFLSAQVSRWLQLALVVLLLSAVWHVASHEIDIANDFNGNHECQVCRLNHIPTAGGTTALVQVVPLLLLSFIPLANNQVDYPQRPLYALGARAPPQY